MKEIISYATSEDGTSIGYRQIGQGKGLIICHGSGRISQNYLKLANALADTFTVYIPDRRGRGLSGPEGAGYNIQKAVADLTAIIQATNADFIFAHSVGGLIALETMLLNPVKKLAVYEPPFSVDHSFPLQWLPAFEEALQQKQLKKAMAVSLKGLQAAPGMGNLPLWALKGLVSVIAALERKKEKGTRMLDLLHTLPADVKMVSALDAQHERYRYINIPVYLLGGENSPAYFHHGLTTLQSVIPQARTNIFPGFDHYSPEEKVDQLSAILRDFYR